MFHVEHFRCPVGILCFDHHDRESPSMSLKAKIEAVIYASEEPVTLAQLVGLLGEEAQTELDRADTAQGSLSLNEPEPATDILNETEEDLEEAAAELDPTLTPEAAADQIAAPAVETQEPASAGEPSEPEAEASPETQTDSGAPEEEVVPVEQEPDPAAVAKAERARMGRLRV